MSYQYNTATSFSDETYLESFVEAVSWTLPSDLQRSLQHLQMLDNDSAKIMKHWRDSQDSCLRGVEAALLGAYRGDDHPITIIPPPSSLPSSSSSGSPAAAAAANIATPTAATKKSPASSERKKACYKCRNKKVRCDGQQPFCLNKAEYNNGIATATSSVASFNSDAGGDSDYNSPPQKKTKLLSNNNNDGKGDDDTNNNKVSSSTTVPLPRLDKSRPPNTAEIESVLQKRNPHYKEQRAAITDMYHKLQQCSREKIHTAHQLQSMIDMALGRLSRDMKKFENDLGLLPSSSSSPAAAVTAGGGGMGASLLPVAEMNQSQSVLDAATTTAPTTTTSAAAATKPANATALPLPPNATNINKNLAAIQTTPNAPEWILANIISFDEYTRMYTLSDEDQSSNEIYTIPSRQVRPLLNNSKGGNNNERTKNSWVKGDEIYAVYPDTTSFYPATVVSSSSGFVMVHFKDDWDANGVIHEKAIPMQYVMKYE